MKQENRVFPAEYGSISQILGWASACLELHRIPADDRRKLELALEESVVNAIVHGTQGEGAHITLFYRFLPSEYFEWELVDEGTFFNLLTEKKEPKGKEELEKEGGWGIILIHKTMDFIDYYRKEGRNHLLLRKKLR